MRLLASFAMLVLAASLLPAAGATTVCAGPSNDVCVSSVGSSAQGCSDTDNTVTSSAGTQAVFVGQCGTIVCVVVHQPVLEGDCTASNPHTQGTAACYDTKDTWWYVGSNDFAYYEPATECWGVLSTSGPAYACAGDSHQDPIWSYVVDVCGGVLAEPETCNGAPGNGLFLNLGSSETGTLANQQIACTNTLP
jgi:hypothetical protein